MPDLSTTDSSIKEQVDDSHRQQMSEKSAPSEKEGDPDDSMSQERSIVEHSTPVKGFDTSYEDLTSPQQAQAPASSLVGGPNLSHHDSPATPHSATSYEPESSFEIISGGQSPEWTSSGRSSRIVSSSSAGATSTSSFFSQPKPTKVTISAPPDKDQLTPSRVVQTRPYAGLSLSSRLPSTRPQASSLRLSSASDTSLPHETRNRASSRSSLSPKLSPIPDAASQDSGEGAKAILPNLGEQGTDEGFPDGVIFAYIVEHGKNSIGDLTKSARKALARLGLKSIPSMHGPLSLPYARCPSGIDAFLFSVEKEEDPWTFLLEDQPRRGAQRFTQAGYRINPVPLPGNSRYSQASSNVARYPRGVATGGGSSAAYPRQHRRVVSSGSKAWSKSALFAGSSTLDSPEQEVATPATTSVEPMLAMQQSQLGGVEYSAPVYDSYAQRYPPPPSAHSTRAPTPYQQQQQPLPAAYPPSPYAPPSPYWPMGGFPFPTAAEFMQSLHHQRAASPYSRPQSVYPQSSPHPSQAPTPAPPSSAAPYGYPPPSQSRAPLLDPAIVAYGKKQQEQYQQQQQQWQRGDSIYYTAPSEGGSGSASSEGEETQHGGFFFPAVRPVDYDRTSSRRRSVSAGGLTPPPAPRRPSIDLPHVDSRVNERRNSAAPHSGQRRMSLASTVGAVPRRSSVAPQTRLVKDSQLTQSSGHGGMSTSQHHSGGASAVRQPRVPPTAPPTPSSPPRSSVPLVPHHARVTVTEPSPRKNSRARADISTFTAAVRDAGIGLARRGSNASTAGGEGGWGSGRESIAATASNQGWSPQSDSARSRKRFGRGRGRGRKSGPSSVA